METRVKNVWYNPATAAYEGRVDIVRSGRSFRYPCVVEGPVGMPTAAIHARMEAQARRMSDS